MKILVLNCYSRNSLAVINSLDPNYELIGGTSKNEGYLFFKPDRFFKSKRLTEIFRYFDPKTDPEGFKNDIINACKHYKPDAIIPTGTTITNHLSFFKNEINKHTNAKLLVEDYSTLSQLADKWLTHNICLKIDIPSPKTVLLNLQGKISSSINSFKFPIILKPRISYAAKGVKFFKTREDLEIFLKDFKQIYNENNQKDPVYVAQEVIHGELHDVTCCAKDGNVISILSQQRILSLYDFGGGGVINKTTYEPTIMEYAEKIINHVKWSGVMLFDFIRDREGKYYLLECNPKIWGTTQLTTEAGLNMVQQLIDLFVLDRKIKTRDNYIVGMVYKWIFPLCIFSWIQKPRTLNRIIKRIFSTLRKYNASKSLNNLNMKDLPHLIGAVLDRSVF